MYGVTKAPASDLHTRSKMNSCYVFRDKLESVQKRT